MKSEQVNLRLEVDLIAALEEAAKEESLDRATVIRKLLRHALSQRKLDRALEQYQRGDVSIGRATELAGMSHWEMIEISRHRGATSLMTIDDVDAILRSLPKQPPRVAESAADYSADSDATTGQTLPDRPPRPGGILLVGINPSPPSVDAGHYYQGRLGKRLWQRLIKLRLLFNAVPGSEDDAFVREGHGLTDVVKRPSSSANQLSTEELTAGARVLRDKIAVWRPGLVLFAFKMAATAATESSFPPGMGPPIAGVPTFLLSGPYTRREDAADIDDQLLSYLATQHQGGGSLWTQRMMAKDIDAGIVRLPKAAKSLFPPEQSDIEIVLRGSRVSARYDPRRGSDRSGSGVLRVQRGTLRRLVKRNDRLHVSRGLDGIVRLD